MSRVEIISITKPEKNEFKHLSPEELIVAIARVSNQKNELNTATAPKLLKFCILNNHWSIFQQVDICFKVRTSRAIAAQILRHYSADFQELSQRYTTVPDIEPIELRYQGKSNRQVGEEPLDNNDPLYNVVQTEIDNAKRAYNKLIDGGVAKEVARMIMPLSSSTDLYMKNNVRNWLAYFNVRLHKHCQKEHRDIAWQILEVFKVYFPEITKVFHNYEFALNHHMFDTLVLEKYLGETKMREILTQQEEK